jgi:hypothetical protein
MKKIYKLINANIIVLKKFYHKIFQNYNIIYNNITKLKFILKIKMKYICKNLKINYHKHLNIN